MPIRKTMTSVKLLKSIGKAGAELWIVREKYLSLLTDVRTGDVSLESIRARRDALLDELHAVYVGKLPAQTLKPTVGHGNH